MRPDFCFGNTLTALVFGVLIPAARRVSASSIVLDRMKDHHVHILF